MAISLLILSLIFGITETISESVVPAVVASSASLMEGVGDEVVYTFVFCLIVTIALLAWSSTRVRNDAHLVTYHVFHLVNRSPSLNNDDNTQVTGVAENANGSEQVAFSSETRTITNLPPITLAITESNRARPTRVTVTAIQPNLNESSENDSNTLAEISTRTATSSDSELEPNNQEVHADIDDFHEPVQSSSGPSTMESEREESHNDAITIRLKYLDDRQKEVSALPNDSITLFKRKFFEEELSANKQVRLIFCGRELDERSNATLSEYGVTHNATVHCLISSTASSTSAFSTRQDTHRSAPASSQGGEEVDLGMFMFPSFGLILVAIWYCRVIYRHYFNVMSTFALVGISVLYVVTLFTFCTTRGGASDTGGSPGRNQRSTTSSPIIDVEVTTRGNPTGQGEDAPAANSSMVTRTVHYHLPLIGRENSQQSAVSSSSSSLSPSTLSVNT